MNFIYLNLFFVFSWSIVDEKCVIFRCAADWFSYTYTCIYSPTVLEERLGYVCVLYVCLYVCAIDDKRGHKLVVSWCVLPHTVCLKLKTAFGNRRLHMQVQASSFFWNLDESAARATSPRGHICWVRWRLSPFLGVCSAGCHSAHPGASVCPPACTPARPCRSVLPPGPCRRLD